MLGGDTQHKQDAGQECWAVSTTGQAHRGQQDRASGGEESWSAGRCGGVGTGQREGRSRGGLGQGRGGALAEVGPLWSLPLEA